MPEPSTAVLLDLPLELHLEIINHLDYPSCLTLSQTNSYFRCIIPAKELTKERKLQFLLAAESRTEYVLTFVQSDHHRDPYTDQLTFLGTRVFTHAVDA